MLYLFFVFLILDNNRLYCYSCTEYFSFQFFLLTEMSLLSESQNKLQDTENNCSFERHLPERPELGVT